MNFSPQNIQPIAQTYKILFRLGSVSEGCWNGNDWKQLNKCVLVVVAEWNEWDLVYLSQNLCAWKIKAVE